MSLSSCGDLLPRRPEKTSSQNINFIFNIFLKLFFSFIGFENRPPRSPRNDDSLKINIKPHFTPQVR
jgi:hypothetical protein